MNKKLHDIMTAHTRCVPPDCTLADAARQMRELDVGSLPICENDRLIGIVTDRDIVLRCIAERRDASKTHVRDVMTPGIIYAFEDDDTKKAAHLMEEHQIRRLAVLNRQKRLVGIVSLGDISVRGDARISGDALQGVSEPPVPVREPVVAHR